MQRRIGFPVGAGNSRYLFSLHNLSILRSTDAHIKAISLFAVSAPQPLVIRQFQFTFRRTLCFLSYGWMKENNRNTSIDKVHWKKFEVGENTVSIGFWYSYKLCEGFSRSTVSITLPGSSVWVSWIAFNPSVWNWREWELPSFFQFFGSFWRWGLTPRFLKNKHSEGICKHTITGG